MANLTARVNARRLLAQHVTLHVSVTGMRLVKWRLRCAVPLLRLAAWIAGVGINLDLER